MGADDSYPAITGLIGGKQRRLTLGKQWRRAIANRELRRDTLVDLEAGPGDNRMCLAGDIFELQHIFDELLGAVEVRQPVSEDSQQVTSPVSVDNLMNNSTNMEQPVKAGSLENLKPTTSLNETPATTERTQIASALTPSGNREPTFLEYALIALKRFADFSGRSRRREYWSFIIALNFVFLVLILISSADQSNALMAIVILSYLVLIIPQLAVSVRRLHDSNRSGWWVAGLLVVGPIPGIGLIAYVVFLIMTVLPGTTGPNRFGHDPKELGSAKSFER